MANATIETAKVDDRGRVTIPEVLREQIGIQAGDVLCLIEKEEGDIIITKLSLDDILREGREDYEEGRTIPHEEVFQDM